MRHFKEQVQFDDRNFWKTEVLKKIRERGEGEEPQPQPQQELYQNYLKRKMLPGINIPNFAFYGENFKIMSMGILPTCVSVKY